MNNLQSLLEKLVPGTDQTYLKNRVFEAIVKDIKAEAQRIWSASVCHKDKEEKHRGSIAHANAMLLIRLLRGHEYGRIHQLVLTVEAHDDITNERLAPFSEIIPIGPRNGGEGDEGNVGRVPKPARKGQRKK